MCEPVSAAITATAAVASAVVGGVSAINQGKQADKNAAEMKKAQDAQLELLRKQNDQRPLTSADPSPESTLEAKQKKLEQLRYGFASTIKTSPTGLSGMKPISPAAPALQASTLRTTLG